MNNLSAMNVNLTQTPFFIHIPKNMGNFIYRRYYYLQQTDKTPFYGMYDSIHHYYDTHKIPRPKRSSPPPYNTTSSIDHLTPVELFQLGILKPLDLKRYVFFAILREPIDRFISLCNYWDLTPDEMIYNIQNIHLLKGTKYNLYQHLRPQSDYVADMKRIAPQNHRLFSMDKKEEIKAFLLLFFPDKRINYDEKVYHSRDKYTAEMLSPEHVAFLHAYYGEDMELYRSL